ncbi:hypothetical protein Clacol_003436 [Clathrus columnatus]|uniref:Uncharacterized protein n=1 Tax=Clathrus columnatus TaxID=1419009 RepID=A0AAV5A7J1_9AGAM|nr:hypothetical protein Clacol_003436 [Clathrus columnatus]
MPILDEPAPVGELPETTPTELLELIEGTLLLLDSVWLEEELPLGDSIPWPCPVESLPLGPEVKAVEVGVESEIPVPVPESLDAPDLLGLELEAEFCEGFGEGDGDGSEEEVCELTVFETVFEKRNEPELDVDVSDLEICPPLSELELAGVDGGGRDGGELGFAGLFASKFEPPFVRSPAGSATKDVRVGS